MKINILAGRNSRDLTQYPVFPWIFNDYSSESIDINNSDVYRDLTKNMGSLVK